MPGQSPFPEEVSGIAADRLTGVSAGRPLPYRTRRE